MVLANKQYAASLPLKTPNALIRCRSEADVVRSVRSLASFGGTFSVRSGGHCFSDLSSWGDIQLDLSEMNEVHVAGGEVRVGPGALAGDVVQELIRHGLSLPTGGCPLVAIGGLALVGGFGFLGRRHGLLADRMVWARVVLANGRTIVASAETEAELFWALRGAGSGGFGVVTEIAFRSVSASAALACTAVWPIAAATEVIDRWQGWAPFASGDANIELSLISPQFAEEPCYIRLYGLILGTGAEAQPALRGLHLALGPFAGDLKTAAMAADTTALHAAGVLTFDGQRAWFPSWPYEAVGYQATRSNFLEDPIPSVAIEQLVSLLQADRAAANSREVELVPWGGAYAEPNSAACFGHRDALLLLRHSSLAGSRSSEEIRQRAAAWASRSARILEADGAGPIYQGYAEVSRADWKAACYGAAYDRLESVKKTYDPACLFSGPQAIGC